MSHFITVPEIIDSSVKPVKTKDRFLNTDHIVSFSATGPDRVSVQTTKDTIDVNLPDEVFLSLCSPEVVVTGERWGLSPEDLGRFIARSQEPITEIGYSYPQMADIGSVAEGVKWDYPEVKLSGVEVGEAYVLVEGEDNKNVLYHLAGYVMSNHPHKTAVSNGLLTRYKEARKHAQLPTPRHFKVVVGVRSLISDNILGFEFEDHTQDDKTDKFPVWEQQMGHYNAADYYLIGEVVKAEDITVGPLYLMVAKPEKRLNLFRINSSTQTQHNLRRVYQALQKEFTDRNLADVVGQMEYWTLGRAATYNHEFVVFHVTPFHSEGELATTQQWTLDRQQIVVPENSFK